MKSDSNIKVDKGLIRLCLIADFFEIIVEDDAGHLNSLLVVEELNDKVDVETEGLLYS